MIADSSQAGRIGRAESAPRASIRGACRFDVLHSKSLGVLWLIVFISLMGFGMTAIPFPLVAEQMDASDFWKTFGGFGVFSLLLARAFGGAFNVGAAAPFVVSAVLTRIGALLLRVGARPAGDAAPEMPPSGGAIG